MNIFLTGGSGFIGRNIIEQLGSKHTILAPSHAELELLDENAVRDYLSEHAIDIVVHGAVRPGHRNAKDPSRQIDNNLRMFFNIIRNDRLFRKMFVLSSGLVYDMRHYQPKMSEDYFDEHVPLDEGGFSKYVIAKHCQCRTDITELRVFGIFGKYEDYAIRFISNAACKAVFDLPITIKQNRRFDYIYINDFISVLDRFITTDIPPGAYNITPDDSIELLTLAEKVRSSANKDLPILVAQEGMGIEYSGSNSRLRSVFPDLSFTPVDTAISLLYDWYRGNQHLLQRELLLHDK